MSSFWNFAFGAILVILWIISGGFVTQANVYLGQYKNTDSDLHRAYWYTFWAAFVTWFLVGVFIILVILSFIGVVALFGSGAGEAGIAAEGTEGASIERRAIVRKNYATSTQGQETISKGISWVTIGFLIFALTLVGITGVLSALAASSMIKSSNYNPSISKFKTAYTDCVIAASICLGAGGILIIGIITYFIVGFQHQKNIDAEKQYIDKTRQLQLSEIDQLKIRSARQKIEEQAVFKQELLHAQRQALLNKISKTPIRTS